MKNDEMRWICDECGEPIEEGEGGIEAYNLKKTLGLIGAYPIKSSPTEPLGMKQVEPGRRFVFYTVDELFELDYETNKTVGIQVVHVRCHQSAQCGYWIAVERASTADEWVKWLAHLLEKNWCGEVEALELAEIWLRKRRAVGKVAQ